MSKLHEVPVSRSLVIFAMVLGAAISGWIGARVMEPSRVTAQERPVVRGLVEDRAQAARAPKPVRNDVAQPGEDIVTLRHWRIKKGEFPAFLDASVNGVWPFFEKIGARVVGMWQEIHPDGTGAEGSQEYDDVYLMTRYASVAHWRATRDMSTHGGNGPDWEKCWEALQIRRALTIETSLTFLQGRKWHNDPWFLPGLDEEYSRVE